MPFAHHTETRVHISASTAEVFAFLDDQEALGAHMTRRSAAMAGGRMTYDFDDGKGRLPGSVIRMRGEMLGMKLLVEEAVIQRVPPQRKVLETRGDQNMIVIDAYRLGFEIQPDADGSELRVFIDYDVPPGWFGFVARFPAYFYARWCVAQMADAAVERFTQTR